jgi:hypothetical protein
MRPTTTSLRVRGRAVAALAFVAVAIGLGALGSACEPNEGWRCCQSTPYTCVCSAGGYCSGADTIEKCSEDTVPGDDNFCCAHEAASSCSCSGSDGGQTSDGQCTGEGETRVQDCTTEPTVAPSGACVAAEAGTTGAPCSVDSDCYSAFCDTSAAPPACATPTRMARVEGHGYDCATDADCAAVAPDFVSRGGTATCHDDAAEAGCELTCDAAPG